MLLWFEIIISNGRLFFFLLVALILKSLETPASQDEIPKLHTHVTLFLEPHFTRSKLSHWHSPSHGQLIYPSNKQTKLSVIPQVWNSILTPSLFIAVSFRRVQSKFQMSKPISSYFHPLSISAACKK